MNLTGQSQIDQARLEWAIRLRFSPFPELSMERIATELNSFRIGDLWRATRTWEIMIERDGDLSANINKRCEDVAALEWEVMSDGTAEGDAHAEALRYFYDHCTVTNALDQDEIGDVSKLIFNIAYAHATKYSIHEMLMRVDDAAAREVTCEFRYTPAWLFECRRGYLGFLQHVFDVYGQPLKLGEWLPAVGYGHMRACSVLYAMKHFAMRDWLLYCSRYGFPAVQLLTDATKDSPEWNALSEAYEHLANDGVLITNKGVEIKALDIATKGELPFRPIIEDVNRGYSKLFRGSDLATSSRAKEGGEGKTVGASVQGGEKDILLQYDARWATPMLNFRVDRPVIRYLFNCEPCAWIKILGPSDEDSQQDLLNFQFAVQNEIPIAISTVRERLNIPEPAPGEPVLHPAAPALPAMGDLIPAPPKPELNGSARNGNGTREYAPGADPNRNPQTIDMRLPGGSKPLNRYTFPGGQENALGNVGDLNTAATHHYVHALQTDLQPVIDRINAILKIEDPDAAKNAWTRFLTWLDKFKTSLQHDPATAEALQQIMAASFANGIANKAGHALTNSQTQHA